MFTGLVMQTRHQPHPVRDGVMEETARSDGRDTSRTARNSRHQSLTCKSSMRITGLIYCLAFIEILHNNEIFGLESHRASGQSSIERKMCRKFAVEPLYDRTDTRIIITNHIRNQDLFFPYMSKKRTWSNILD